MKINKILELLVCFFIISTSPALYAEGELQSLSLNVKGMQTASCPVLLKTSLNKVAGVKRVDASLAKHHAQIAYDADVISAQEIQAIIKDKTGFTTTKTD